MLALGLLPALAMRPFTVGDENAHTSYALQVASGSLPTMRTQTEPRIPGMRRQDTYVANHPPLYYAVVGVPMRLGVAAGKPVAGFLLGRVVTLFWVTGAVLVVGLLARAAWPSRPALAVAAPALLAATPLLPSTGAQIANDSAALATVAAVLVLAVRLYRAPSRRRLVALSMACVLAALTRSSGVQVTALAALLAVGSFVRRPLRPATLVRPVLAGLAVVAPAALASGWFYLRNRQLYGDVVGARYALALFPSERVGLDRTLPSGTFWVGQLRQLLTRPQYVTGPVRLLGVIVALLIAAGLVALGVRAAGRLPHRSPDVPTVVVGTFLAVQFCAGWAGELGYVARGGLPYVRYALPAFPVVALLAGGALLALPLGRRGAFVVAVVGMLSVTSVVVLSKGIAFHHPGWERYGILERYRVGFAANGLPAPTLVLAVLLGLVATAIVGLTWSLVREPNDLRPLSRSEAAGVAG